MGAHLRLRDPLSHLFLAPGKDKLSGQHHCLRQAQEGLIIKPLCQHLADLLLTCHGTLIMVHF